MTRRVLIVDDQADQRATLARGLRLFGFDCASVPGPREALAALETRRFDALLADLTMPGSSGAALVAEVRVTTPDLPILVLTGLVTSPEVVALRAGGVPILQKPFTAEQLGRAIAALGPNSQKWK